jgi:uncharacterized protein (DUF362 family)
VIPSSKAQSVTRREFLIRSAKAGAGIATAGGLSLWLYDSHAPQLSQEKARLVTLPDFSIPSRGGQMSIVTGEDRVKTVRHALKTLGGMEAFIRPGDRVLLKVNAAFATPPILSATANPELVGEVARLCFKAGAFSVTMTDNPINDAVSCFTLTGLAQAAHAVGAQVVTPKESYFKPTTLPNGTLIRHWPLLYTPFEDVDKLIGIAPVKDHHRSGASMTMKNWYGLLGGRRNLFHQDIHNIIKELAMMVSPTLVILDGTVTMMTNGPTGGSLADLKHTNTMIVSTDQVAADAFGATLLGKTASDLPYIAKAQAEGVGQSDYGSLTPLRDHVG